MIPFDIKNYRSRSNSLFDAPGWAVAGIVGLIMLLGWMGERDREAQVERVREAAQCVK
jgi:hypothetical protein